jgi:hypothetical protein
MKSSDKNTRPELKPEIEITESDYRRIKENMERSDTEKFHLFCRLMRIQMMLDNARVIHK